MKPEWTESNINMIKAMYNSLQKYFKEKDGKERNIPLDEDFSFLGLYSKTIYEIYSKKSQETKKKAASTLYKYFTLEGNLRQAKHWKYLFQEDTKKTFEKQDNTLSDRQEAGWLYMDDLKEKIDELYKTRLNSLRDNENYLLLMVHYYGPLRSSYYFNLPISDKKIEQKQFNYIYLPKAKKADAFYFVYDDKVSDTKSHYDNVQILIKPELKKALQESIKEFPREFLFPSFKNELIFNRALKKLTGAETNNQILRVSYETERYLNVALIGGDYAKFAKESKDLRHNVHVVLTTYVKNIHKLPKLKEKLIRYYLKLAKHSNISHESSESEE